MAKDPNVSSITSYGPDGLPEQPKKEHDPGLPDHSDECEICNPQVVPGVMTAPVRPSVIEEYEAGLNKLPVTEVRALAKEADVAGRSNMKKEQLVGSLVLKKLNELYRLDAGVSGLVVAVPASIRIQRIRDASA